MGLRGLMWGDAGVFIGRGPSRLGVAARSSYGRSVTAIPSNACATEAAVSPFTGCRPSRSPARRPCDSGRQNPTPPSPYAVRPPAERQRIYPLVQPFTDSTIASARSPLSHRSEHAKSRSACNCSVLASIRGRPAMTPRAARGAQPYFYEMWHHQANPAYLPSGASAACARTSQRRVPWSHCRLAL